MTESALLQLGNGILSAVAAIFIFGARPQFPAKRASYWFAASVLMTAILYFSQFVTLLNSQPYIPFHQVYFALILMALASLFLGVAVFSCYMPNPQQERTVFLLLSPVLLGTIAIDIYFPGWYSSATISFLLFTLLAWPIRKENITVAMVFLAYACLQVPRKVGDGGVLEFDFSLLVASKFALIGAAYKSFEVLQERESVSEGEIEKIATITVHVEDLG